MLKLDVQKSHISNKYVMNEVCILRYNIIFVGRGDVFFFNNLLICLQQEIQKLQKYRVRSNSSSRVLFFQPSDFFFLENTSFTKKSQFQVKGGYLDGEEQFDCIRYIVNKLGYINFYIQS
eukprot:TRINITY_DN6323_c0_g1_i4.p1 TRINITY_DN6323_c0_g1~~TRINITY_DN6323_c0_g1_i4.p1  ORF type:complete len:120 (+),score=4.10 TRINITY_DN6323_c0_g1_i4:79-438(+)